MQAVVSSESHLYEQTADKIVQLIERGTLRPGDRVPSVRRLSERHGISVSTVLQAYTVLENKGLIEARPQSGYYVRFRFRELPPEPAKTEPPLAASRVGVGDLVAKIMQAVVDPDIVQLGAGCPSPELLPSDKLNRALASVARRPSGSTNKYDAPAGNLELRREIARRSLDYGCALSKEEIVATCGCMEALNL